MVAQIQNAQSALSPNRISMISSKPNNGDYPQQVTQQQAMAALQSLTRDHTIAGKRTDKQAEKAQLKIESALPYTANAASNQSMLGMLA